MILDRCRRIRDVYSHSEFKQNQSGRQLPFQILTIISRIWATLWFLALRARCIATCVQEGIPYNFGQYEWPEDKWLKSCKLSSTPMFMKSKFHQTRVTCCTRNGYTRPGQMLMGLSIIQGKIGFLWEGTDKGSDYGFTFSANIELSTGRWS